MNARLSDKFRYGNHIVEGRAVVDGFLLGLPKSGTTWLATVLSQNPQIDFSDPKEPNIIGSHNGTFGRDDSEPEIWRYEEVFSGSGFRVDGSVHTFSCPHAPRRVHSVNPNSKFVLCLREPVDRACSHWRMIVDNRHDVSHGCDWSKFDIAWEDARLRVDSVWSDSIKRWLEYFDINQFLFIDAEEMRSGPKQVLTRITTHFGLPDFNYNHESVRDANTADDRRPMTIFGRLLKSAFALIPSKLRGFLAKPLQKRAINIYSLPILSRSGKVPFSLEGSHYEACKEEVIPDLVEFERITGFSTKKWLSNFHHD